jgi:hypothetical protein
MHTLTIETLSPKLAKMMRHHIQEYLSAIERVSSDASIKRAASYAATKIKLEA